MRSLLPLLAGSLQRDSDRIADAGRLGMLDILMLGLGSAAFAGFAYYLILCERG